MVPLIEFSENTFRRLQELAVPFVDTPETVVRRLLDAHISSTVAQPAASHASIAGYRVLNPDAPGELRHTKVLSAKFAGRTGDKWNELLTIAHEEARERLGSFAAVRKASQSALAQGQREDSGFHFQQKIEMSIQYVDSNKAWQQSLWLAKQLGVAIEVQFRWREKEGATHPGELGLLRWSPA